MIAGGNHGLETVIKYEFDWDFERECAYTANSWTSRMTGHQEVDHDESVQGFQA